MKIHDTQTLPDCDLGGLVDELKRLWEKIEEVNDHDLRQSTY